MGFANCYSSILGIGRLGDWRLRDSYLLIVDYFPLTVERSVVNLHNFQLTVDCYPFTP